MEPRFWRTVHAWTPVDYPFDRLLVAQAQVEDVSIVTVDPSFDAYDVSIVRASA